MASDPRQALSARLKLPIAQTFLRRECPTSWPEYAIAVADPSLAARQGSHSGNVGAPIPQHERSEHVFYLAASTPQAMRPPALPAGSLTLSSALAWITIAAPSASSNGVAPPFIIPPGTTYSISPVPSD